MKYALPALSASILLAACGQVSNNPDCDLTVISTKASSWPDDQARTKSLALLKQAREAREKKDFAACETLKKKADEVLKF